MALKLQDMADALKWARDWSDFLATGENITSRQWTIDPDESPPLLTNPTSENVTVSNLRFGVVYRVSLAIVTDAGNTAKRSFTIECGPH